MFKGATDNSFGSCAVAAASLQYVSLEEGKYALDELAHLRQRWNDRLTVNNLALSKRYIEGKLNLVVRCTRVRNGHPEEVRAILQRELPICRTESECPKTSHHFGELGSFFSSEAVLGGGSHIGQKINGIVAGPYRYDRLVLVEDVELMESPKRFIPSLVWFQALKDQPSSGRSPLYVFAKVGFEFLFGFPDDEMHMVVTLPTRIAASNNCNCEQVKTRPRVVNCITDDGAEILGNAFADFDLPNALSRCHVILDNDGIRLAGEEGLYPFGQFCDVGFGPFDL